MKTIDLSAMRGYNIYILGGLRIMERRNECRYCGRVAHGYGCGLSPNHYHMEEGDPDHCVWCGSTSYGYSCGLNPTGMHVHVHGHGDGKCIYCGKPYQRGRRCPASPSGLCEA